MLIPDTGGSVPGGGLTPYQIYVQVTGGPGPGTLNGAQQVAEFEAQREEDRASRIERLAAKVQAGWQGEAGEAAHGAAAPLLAAVREGAGSLQQTNGLLAVQSGMFTHVRGEVKPVPEKPPQSNVLNDMIPWETDLDREIKDYQAKAQHNITVYAAYDTASWDNELALPSWFGSVTDPGGEISVVPPEGRPGEPGDDGRTQRPPMPARVESGGDMHGTDESGLIRGEPPVPPVDSERPVQLTDPSALVPGPGTNLPLIGQNSGGPGPVSGWQGGGPVSVGVAAGSGRGGADTGAERGGQNGGRSGAGGQAGSGRSASGGGRSGAGAQPGGARLGADGRSGGVLGEESGRRGGGGAAGGRGGVGGMGPMGAGRGQGDEDGEHQRPSYLTEPDPEEIFGTDQATAPPVIGG